MGSACPATTVQNAAEITVGNMGNIARNVVTKNIVENTDQNILAVQLRRFQHQFNGKQNPEIVGLKYIENFSENLKTLINSNRIKLLRCEAENDSILRLTLQNPGDEVWAQIEAGTLLVPKYTAEQNFQTLVVRQASYTTIPNGTIERALNILCYDCQKDVPANKCYQLGTLKAIQFQQGMTQKDAWRITINPQTLEMKPQSTLPVNKIVFTEKEVQNIMKNMKAAEIPKDSLMCSLCCQRRKDYLNLNCKQLCCCEQCGKKLKKCPLCPAPMKGIKIYV